MLVSGVQQIDAVTHEYTFFSITLPLWFIISCWMCLVVQSYPTVCDPMGYLQAPLSMEILSKNTAVGFHAFLPKVTEYSSYTIQYKDFVVYQILDNSLHLLTQTSIQSFPTSSPFDNHEIVLCVRVFLLCK